MGFLHAMIHADGPAWVRGVSVTLAAVEPGVVSIDQDGVIEQAAVSVRPVAPIQGFVPAAAFAAARP